jgi:hypothetical protein
MKNVYLVVKVNVTTKEMIIVSDNVYTSRRFAEKFATDCNDNCFDSSKFNYQVKEFGVDDFQTAEDLEEQE